eukprot:scaffold69251_cov71-Phaeocystis_antarctica.AAC.4
MGGTPRCASRRDARGGEAARGVSVGTYNLGWSVSDARTGRNMGSNCATERRTARRSARRDATPITNTTRGGRRARHPKTTPRCAPGPKGKEPPREIRYPVSRMYIPVAPDPRHRPVRAARRLPDTPPGLEIRVEHRLQPRFRDVCHSTLLAPPQAVATVRSARPGRA